MVQSGANVRLNLSSSEFLVFANKTIFDLLDLGIANILLPLNALLIALFIGWAVRQTTTGQWITGRPLAMSLWRFALRILAPVSIVGLFVSSWH